MEEEEVGSAVNLLEVLEEEFSEFSSVEVEGESLGESLESSESDDDDDDDDETALFRRLGALLSPSSSSLLTRSAFLVAREMEGMGRDRDR